MRHCGPKCGPFFLHAPGLVEWAGGAQQPEQLGGQCSVDPVGLSGEAFWSEQVSSTKHRCLGEKLGLG